MVTYDTHQKSNFHYQREVSLNANLTIECIPEYELLREQRSELQTLLSDCFPDYLSRRIYYKQLPQFRLLGRSDKVLVSQVGVEHRMISVNNDPFRIFGVIDLCCDDSFRGKGMAALLLENLKTRAILQGIDFIVLFADDQRLYQREGYIPVNNKCKWLGIDEHKTVGIIEEDLSDCMMVLPIGQNRWPSSPVDMLGYLY